MAYSVRATPIATTAPAAGHLRVDIFDSEDRKVGEYVRTYPSMYRTFCAFSQEGREFALYAPSAYCTRIMTLPDCVDVGGETYGPAAFCPTDYFVPDEFEGKFGFIAGCHWGDDSSWKIQFLDLREPGHVLRLERFGYAAMPNAAEKLSDVIQIERYNDGVEVRIQTELLVAIEDEEFAEGIRNDNEFYGLAGREDRQLRELRAEIENLKKRLTEVSKEDST